MGAEVCHIIVIQQLNLNNMGIYMHFLTSYGLVSGAGFNDEVVVGNRSGSQQLRHYAPQHS